MGGEDNCWPGMACRGERYRPMHGEVVLRIPGSCLAFRPKLDLLQVTRERTPQAHWTLSLCVIVRANAEFLHAHAPPMDIEDAYLNWCELEMQSEAKSESLDWSAMRRLYLYHLREQDRMVAAIFSPPL